LSSRPRGLELPELGFVTRLVAAREIARLFDHPVAGQAALEGAKIGIDRGDLFRAQRGDLFEAGEAAALQQAGD